MASKAELEAWLKEWNKICDEALRRIKQGESDAGQFIKDAVRSSKKLPDIAQDALGKVIEFVLSLGQGALEEGLILAREAGALGLRLRALFA